MQSPLKLLRQSVGLTQEDFGATIGVTKGRVSQLESDPTSGLRGSNLRKLADTYRVEIARLGLSLEDFLAREQPRRSA